MMPNVSFGLEGHVARLRQELNDAGRQAGSRRHTAQGREVGLRPIDLAEFLALELPPREYVIEEWLPTAGLVMMYGPRGAGKTWLALSIGCAVAAGTPFLRFATPQPRPVLYVDGEMPAVTMQERVGHIVKAAPRQPEPGYFRLLTPDVVGRSLPNLATSEGQRALDETLDGVGLLILDNVSALTAGAAENEALGWEPVQEWLLGLRRRGVAVLLLHHAGKGGAQRGTSKREDTLDAVVALRRPADYRATDGLRVEWHFEKLRCIGGQAAAPFELRLDIGPGESAVWTTRSLDERVTERVGVLLNDGLSHREVARELGIGVASVSRHRRKAQGRGLLS